jgi:O-antigen/teichoic acid export membrane protein
MMFKNIISTFFTRFFSAASNLLIAILLSNYLGAAGRGEQSLMITLITFIMIITGVIGSSSISYLVPRSPFPALIFPSYLWVFTVIILCFLFLPYMGLVPAQYTTDVCILSFLLSILNIHISVLISHQRINAANFLGFFQSFIIVAVLVVTFVFMHDKSIRSYILALYAGFGSTMLMSTWMIGRYFTGIRDTSFKTWIEAVRKLTVLGFYNQVAVFTQLLSFRLSYYILNAGFGSNEVGIYSNAVSIAESVWLIGRSIGTVQHSRIVNSHDAGFSLSLTTRLNRINLTVSIVLITLLACIPGSWYQFLFGEEFAGINHIIWTLCPGIVFFGVALVLGYYFSSTGKHIVNAIASTAGLAVTIILGFSIIPVWSSHGAGITASVSYGITALVVAIFYVREKRKLKSEI